MLHNIQKKIFCQAVEGQYSTILVIIVMRLIVLMWNRMCHRFVIPDQEWVQAVINQSHPPTYPWKRWWLWWISARQTNFYELINFVSNIWQHDKLSILWQTIQQWCLDLGNRILGALIGECNKTFFLLWKESQKKRPFFWVPKFGGGWGYPNSFWHMLKTEKVARIGLLEDVGGGGWRMETHCRNRFWHFLHFWDFFP